MKNFVKNYFAHVAITVVAIILGVLYFYPEYRNVIQPYATMFLVVYGIVLVFSMFVSFIVNIIHLVAIKHQDSLDKQTLEALLKYLHIIYSNIAKKKGIGLYYTPVLSLIVVFLSGGLGYWVLAILEGFSEFINIRLIEKSKRYAEIDGQQSQNS